MKSFFAKEVLAHPAVLGACAASLCIAAGSGWYYRSQTALPATYHAALAAPAPAAIAAQGTVVPTENPDLYFEAAGRVASVTVQVGDAVSQGELLASLDTSALSAARDQAQASVRLAEAKLDALTAGARAVDVSAKETAVSQAAQQLANLYAQVPTDLASAYSNMLGAVHADTDALFNAPDTNPTLAFPTTDAQSGIDAAARRAALNDLLNTWQGELAASSADPASLDAALAQDAGYLESLRSYANLLAQALGSATLTTTFTASSVTTAETNLALLRAGIASSVSALQADRQQIASQKLAVQSAKDALAQIKAPATAQDLEAAQAAVDAAQATLGAAQAALNNAVITAPFSGTVSSVRVKVGDFASPSAAAVSLAPASALMVEGYLSEADAALVAPGDSAVVTLDAFGSGKPLQAVVASVDRAPTNQNGVPAYKIVLQFADADPSLSAGMTANISITPHAHGN